MADTRLESRSAWLVDRVVVTHSLVLETVGGDRAGEAAAHRYLGNDAVDPAAILTPAIARTAKAAAGRRVVVAQAAPSPRASRSASLRCARPGPPTVPSRSSGVS